MHTRATAARVDDDTMSIPTLPWPQVLDLHHGLIEYDSDFDRVRLLI